MSKTTKSAMGSELCLACGLCCRGVFFPNTMDPKDFGLDSPGPRTTPSCLLHIDNKCSVYDHPRKSSLCDDYQCHLLKKLGEGAVTLASAKSAVAEIVRFYERVAKYLRPDRSTPMIDLALEVWEHRSDEISSGRLSGEQLLDIISFIRLVDQYLKPLKPGFFREKRGLGRS